MCSATRAISPPDQVKALWGEIKAEEKRARPDAQAEGALGGVPLALPALTRALKLQEKAGKVGFDWNDARAVLAKIREEIDEVEAETRRRRAASWRRRKSAICCSSSSISRAT